MNRDEALILLKQHISRDSLLKHSLAVESIMREVAEFLGEDIELWGLTGLLHDIDFQKTESDLSKHGLVAEIIFKELVDPKIIHAIKSHNFENTGINPEGKMEITLIAADAISGLIIAAALVKPEKKLSLVTVDSIKNAFKKKGFAAGSNRENIKRIEEFTPLINFFELSLKGLNKIASELNL